MALENLDGLDNDDNALDIDNDEQHGDGADAALLDMQDTATDASANDVAVDELENTVAALESLLETAEASQEAGGLDPVAAELLQKAVENETAPLGTPAEEIVPALENFTSPSSRRQSTVMACEGIKEWIDKAWAKIKELIQKGRDLAKKLFIQVKQAIQGLERRVKGLKADAANRNGSMPKSGNVELGSDAFTGEGDAAKLNQLLKAILTDYAGAAIGHAKAVASALSAGDAAKVNKEAGAEGGAEGESKEEFTIPPAMKAPIQKLDGFKMLPGGRSIRNAGDTLAIHADKSGSKKYIGKALGLDKINEILTQLEEAAKTVTGFEKNFQEKDRAEEAVIKAGDEFAKKAKSNDKASDPEARAAINAAKDAARLLNQPIKDVLSYSATAINGIAAFVAANLKQYDKK
jgi:hypothetical protein